MIATLLLALALFQEPNTGGPAKDLSGPITVSLLEEELDRSLHWLRSQFDPSKKTFGSVAADAHALLAFAESPRKYRLSDGPFMSLPFHNLIQAQAEDGSFGDAETTRLAARVLEVMNERSFHEAAEKARSAAGTPAETPRPTPEEAEKAARELLRGRNPDGSFGKGPAAVLETAKKIHELTTLHAALKAAEAKKSPRDARALPTFDPAQSAQIDQALERGTSFLLAERKDGGWGFEGRRDAGITAMVASALLATKTPRSPELEKAITEVLDWLVSLQHEDGSIHEGQLANYVTSAAVLGLAQAKRSKDEPVIARAREFLKKLQADEGEGYAPGDRYYGGVGYGGDERPDLSNLQMALEALHESGTPAKDETFQKALVFLQRCQNRSESNDLVLEAEGVTMASGDDGGAAYAPGESKAGLVELPDGRKVPRSYGSMTYALLKSYLFAGLPKDDARVQAAWKWLQGNYTLDVNPGFQTSQDPTAAYQGLFYYFATMAKTLDLFGEETITDADGKPHAWRAELCGRLVAMQRSNGSWINENAERWFEGNPVLATSYAMITLGTARGAH